MNDEVEVFAPYVDAHWKTFTECCQYINLDSEVNFQGEGTIYLSTTIDDKEFKDVYYLFGINDMLYASVIKEDRTDKDRKFHGVYRLLPAILKSSEFRAAQIKNYATKYRPLNTNIQVDCKPYDYERDNKLLISKADKVDLLYSQDLSYKEQNANLKVQTYPSLMEAVRWQKAIDKVNQKTEAFIASRRAKSE